MISKVTGGISALASLSAIGSSKERRGIKTGGTNGCFCAKKGIIMKMKENKLFGVNGLAVVIGAMGLSLCVSPFSNAQVCTTPQTAVEYDSSTETKPDATSDWSLTCIGANGNGNLVDASSGVLVVDDDSPTTKAKYCAKDLFDDSCNPRQDAVYEFSCKAISVTTNLDSWSEEARWVYGCGFSTGDDNTKDFDIRVAVTLNDGVGFWEFDGEGKAHWLDVGGVLQYVDIAQTGDINSPWSQPHTFRIVKDGLLVKMYVDNNSTPSLSFRLTYLKDNYLEDEIKLISTSNPGRSKFELMHFRYRIAATNFNTLSPSNCLGDSDGDGDVDDLCLLLSAWGTCSACAEDLDGDGSVDVDDLARLLRTWESSC